MNISAEIQEIVEEIGATGYKRSLSWKGYEVYEPIFPGVAYIGYPHVVLKKGKVLYTCTPDEGFEYLHYQIRQSKAYRKRQRRNKHRKAAKKY